MARKLTPLARLKLPARPLNALTLGLLDHLALRTRAIDSLLGSPPQLVILGAGLDARAWRLPLTETVVFEIDHPSTQAYKRARVEKEPPRARDVRFVPVDFESQSIASELERAGHESRVPTTWIWEGVTMYLRPEAIEKTLADVRSRSAPGSRVLMTYAEKRAWPLQAVSRPAGELLMRILGEPLHGLTTKEEMHARAGRKGFHIVSDEGPDAWPGPGRSPYIRERLLVLEALA